MPSTPAEIAEYLMKRDTTAVGRATFQQGAMMGAVVERPVVGQTLPFRGFDTSTSAQVRGSSAKSRGAPKSGGERVISLDYGGA